MSGYDPRSDLPTHYCTDVTLAPWSNYLSVPISKLGYIDKEPITEQNTYLVTSALDMMASIEVRTRCAGELLCTRLYR